MFNFIHGISLHNHACILFIGLQSPFLCSDKVRTYATLNKLLYLTYWVISRRFP